MGRDTGSAGGDGVWRLRLGSYPHGGVSVGDGWNETAEECGWAGDGKLLAIPDVDGENAGNSGGLADDIGLEIDLEDSIFTISGGAAVELRESAGVGEERAGCLSAILDDTRNKDHDLAGVRSEDACDDGVVNIAGSRGPDTGEGPGPGCRFAIDHGEEFFARGEFLGKEGEAEVTAHFEGPLVVEGTDEDSGVPAEVSEADAAAKADGKRPFLTGNHFAQAGRDEGVGGGNVAVIEAHHFGGRRGRQWLGAIPIASEGLVGNGVPEANENGMRVIDNAIPEPIEGSRRCSSVTGS